MTADAKQIASFSKAIAQRKEIEAKDRVRFGLALRNRRLELQMKLEDIANLLDVSVQQVNNMESGRNWPSIPAYKKLCHALRVGIPPLITK